MARSATTMASASWRSATSIASCWSTPRTLGLIDVALIPPARARGDYRGMWGTDEAGVLQSLRRTDVLPRHASRCPMLGAESGYSPAPVEVKPVLRVLPNMEVAAIGAELEQGDRLALDAYATKVSDLVWRLDAGTLLAAIEEGRPVVEIQEFLSARSGAPIPDTVARLLDDVADRSAKVHDCGLARLIECADPSLAALIANDSRRASIACEPGNGTWWCRRLRRRRSSAPCARSDISCPWRNTTFEEPARDSA